MAGPVLHASSSATTVPEPVTDTTSDAAPDTTSDNASDNAATAAPAATGRMLRIGAHTYPVILPRIGDPRLHVAVVIITIHVLGQVGLHFWVSVPQILAAILAAAAIEVVLTFRRSRSLVWPASAMLTGSGVALILRVPGTPPNDHWSMHAWYVFAGVAALSLLTKYAIRYRGSHLFNPSNLGLVAAFVVLGSTRVEPLDFWWAPLNAWMIVAYTVILVGGLVITRRLRLLAVAATFWVALATGVALIAATGHCMTARWAFTPVCGFDYWRVIVFSPELLIFLFFMITDPKTVPAGRIGRVVFGFLVAAASTLLMAPQTDEFGTKVGLLGGLVLVCACRPILDRLVPTPGSADDHVRPFATTMVMGTRPSASIVRPVARVGLMAMTVVVVGAGVVVAANATGGVVGLGTDDPLARPLQQIDPATFPTISVEQGVLDWNHEIDGAGARAIVLTLAENLDYERQALLDGDATMLDAVDHGDRLDDMRGRMLDAEDAGSTAIDHYDFDEVNVTLLVPFGRQDGLSLGLESTGTKTTATYDADGNLRGQTSEPFATTFVIRRATGGRWLNVAELPLDSTG